MPLCAARKTLAPKRVEEGKFAAPQYQRSGQGHRVLWRTVPWVEKHDTFIQQYTSLDDRAKDGVDLEREKIKLVVWCEGQKLPHCAEFVLRDFLFTRGEHIESSRYKAMLKKWKTYALATPSPYTLRLPLRGQWHALVDDTLHHQKKHWAVFAFDIVQQNAGHLFAGANVKERHFAWEQPVYAVCDGVVVEAVDEYNDHPIGRPGPARRANSVRLDCGGGVFADYAHLRQGSAVVKKGDRVKAGQMLARVGNSGASGVPHLHFAMTDADGFSVPGRYQFSVYSTTGWKDVNGIDIAEGWHFRSE